MSWSPPPELRPVGAGLPLPAGAQQQAAVADRPVGLEVVDGRGDGAQHGPPLGAERQDPARERRARCFNGVFADAEKYNKNIHYMFMGCGSEENFGTEKMAQQLKDLGIKLDVYVSPGTHHEWLTWRRCFKEFVPHLFKW